jgi:hypothetical protein
MSSAVAFETVLPTDWSAETTSSWVRSDDRAAQALGFVRDGVITGEGPTTRGRMHFSRAIDAADASLCAHILTAPALANAPVSRGEAEMLFAIDVAGSERSDGGRFDDLFAKAVVHHAVAASGLPVPPRSVALAPETQIDRWAPLQAAAINGEVLRWLAQQMRSQRRPNRALLALTAALVGVAALPLAQSVPVAFDL